MKSIYKYKICSTVCGDSINVIEVPLSAKFLKIDKQDINICAWYLVDPDESETKQITWFQCGTGHEYDFLDELKYANTIICDNIGLVWNMFYSEK